MQTIRFIQKQLIVFFASQLVFVLAGLTFVLVPFAAMAVTMALVPNKVAFVSGSAVFGLAAISVFVVQLFSSLREDHPSRKFASQIVLYCLPHVYLTFMYLGSESHGFLDVVSDVQPWLGHLSWMHFDVVTLGLSGCIWEDSLELSSAKGKFLLLLFRTLYSFGAIALISRAFATGCLSSIRSLQKNWYKVLALSGLTLFLIVLNVALTGAMSMISGWWGILGSITAALAVVLSGPVVAVQVAREQARLTHVALKMKTILLGVHEWMDVSGVRKPSSVFEELYKNSPVGWQVHVARHLDLEEQYNTVDLSRLPSGPAEQLDTPWCFAGDSGVGGDRLLSPIALVDPDAFLEAASRDGIPLAEHCDGDRDSLTKPILVEVVSELAQPWMAPQRQLPLDRPLDQVLRVRQGKIVVGMLNGGVIEIPVDV